MLSRATQKYHEENDCSFRFFVCDNHCGMSVQLFNIDHHKTEVCKKRKITCPYGCGEEFRAEALELHTEFCVEQPLPCGIGGVPCTRQLRSWVQGDIFNSNGYLLFCTAHKESPLVYCAKENKVRAAKLL